MNINFKRKGVCDNCVENCEHCKPGANPFLSFYFCDNHCTKVPIVAIEWHNKEGGKTVGGDYCQPCFDKLINNYLKGKIVTENQVFEKALEAKQETLNQLEDRYTKLWNEAKDIEEEISKQLDSEKSMLFKIKFEQDKIMMLKNYKELFKKG